MNKYNIPTLHKLLVPRFRSCYLCKRVKILSFQYHARQVCEDCVNKLKARLVVNNVSQSKQECFSR